MVMGSFELCRWNHAQLPVEPALVEPVDVVEGGMFHILEPVPRAILAD